MRARLSSNRRENKPVGRAGLGRGQTVAPPRIWPRALIFGAIAAVPYLGIAGGLRCDYSQTLAAYHIYAADALLHGQLSLRESLMEKHFAVMADQARAVAEMIQRDRGQRWSPERLNAYLRLSVFHDLAIFKDRFYTYWAPLTPVVLMPFVAAFGPDVSDRFINALFGALNVALAYWMFRNIDRSGLRRISGPCCTALTLLLAFGTVHFWLSCGGRVWFAVQITTLAPLLLSIVALTARRNSPGMYAVSGALFGAAILGRNTELLAGAFYFVVIWLRQRPDREQAVRRFVVRAIAFSLPVIATGLTQMAYNYGRFGDVFESGMGIQVHTGGEPRFVKDFDTYGSFNLVYLTKNLKYYVWNLTFPVIHGRRSFDPEGNSMFLITPPLLFLFLAWRHRDGFTLALLCGAVPIVGALLLFRATGYAQFGNRYLLDAMPFLLLLVATGMNGRLSLAGGVLIIAAIAMNTFGTLGFYPQQTALLHPYLTPGSIAIGAVVLMLAWTAAWMGSPWVRRRLGGPAAATA